MAHGDDTAAAVAGVRASLQQLCEDTKDLWEPLRAVARVDARTLTPLRFHREFVSRNVPVVLTHAMDSPQWEHARSAWQDDEYLVSKAGDARVTVDVTPFGYGDAVLELPGHRDLFVMPEERDMRLEDFLAVFRDRDGFDGVPYLSHQNDSLRDEFPALYQDVPPFVELAKEAFGNDPDAVNIWIGDERAVSSMHKDHYENMYCVVKGCKHFTLLAPSAVGSLYEREFPSARFRHALSPARDGDDPHDQVDVAATERFHERYPEHSAWCILSSPEKGATPWIPVDPLHVDSRRFPRATALRPIECVVNAGETLYLPAMWYHRATQLCPTISVNYWHDMEFDCRYVYFSFAHDVAAAVNAAASARDQREEDTETAVLDTTLGP